MYKEKYLKYKKKYLLTKDTLTYSMNSNLSSDKLEQSNKNKYLEEKNKLTQKGGALEFTSIDTGTYLFRCAPNIENLRTYEGRLANVRECENTGKTGLYFGNRVLISLAMCIEYNKLMEFGVFRVTGDIEPVIKGKYAYREINPERYYQNGSMVPNVMPLPEENVSHIGCDLKLLGSNNTFLLPEHIQMGLDCLGSCEIFLSTLNPDHLRNVELVAVFRFNPDIIRTVDDLHDYMIQNHYPFILQKYIDDGILIQFGV